MVRAEQDSQWFDDVVNGLQTSSSATLISPLHADDYLNHFAHYVYFDVENEMINRLEWSCQTKTKLRNTVNPITTNYKSPCHFTWKPSTTN